MDENEAIQRLSEEWDNGFFSRLRDGKFDESGLHRVIAILEGIDVKDNPTISKELVKVTWFIPIFMTWQSYRVRDNKDEFEKYENAIQSIVEQLYHVLGAP